MTMIIDGTNGLTFPDNSRQYNGYFGFKNRIINGDMRIDQRNAGASVTPTTSNTYTIDRWTAYISTASKFSVQRNAGSVTPPAGFSNYLGITSLSAYSVTSGDYFLMVQNIEGFNVADLAWGTASAQTVTLSFWVRSSLTGTFGGSVKGTSGTVYSYPFSYTISAANTWEQKSITIPGSTLGTWTSDNTTGIQLVLGLGAGSTYSGTAGAWANNANAFTSTGATSVVGTNGATFYITGVQLEEGVVSTNFDVLPYTTQLQLCQRYFETSFNAGTAPANNIDDGLQTVASGATNTTAHISFAVAKRASPTMTFYSSNVMISPTPTNGQWQFNNGTSWANGSSTQTNRARMYGFSVFFVMGLAGGYAAPVAGNWVASSEL